MVGDAAFGLDGGTGFFADVVQRHLHVQLGGGVHALEIDVQDLLLVRVHLHVAQQNLAFNAVQFHVQHAGMEDFLLQGVPQGVVIEFDQLRLRRTPVDDAGRAARDAQTAARTRTLLGALKSDKFHVQLQKRSSPRPVKLRQKRPASRCRKTDPRCVSAQNRWSWSENKLMTDSPLAMR